MNSLILVNSRHAYSQDTEQDLIPVHKDYPNILLEREAAHALSLIMEQLDGWRFIVPVSGWRSLEEQLTIYEESLQENGPEFTAKFVAMPGHSGFIERYPAGKEHITGIAHEPWHFRYVNTPHSEIMTFKGLTLEEYLA